MHQHRPLFTVAALVAIAPWLLPAAEPGGDPEGKRNLVAATFYEAYAGASEPSRIAYEPANVPDAVRLLLAAMAVGVLISGAQDFRAAFRLSGHRRQAR